MTTAHAYSTVLGDEQSGLQIDFATLAREAIAEDLAASIEANDVDGFVRLLRDSAASPEVRALGVFEPGQLGLADVRLLIGAVLLSGTVKDVESAWKNRSEPSDKVSNFIEAVLGSTVLVEYSAPHPERVQVAILGAAGAVGVAAANATGQVMVAAVAAHVGGVALVIASPVGIVVVGVGATVLVYRLLKGRRSPAT